MKQQIANRLGVAHVRDTMMQFVTGAITREQAIESLQIGKTRIYDLRTSYLDGTVSVVMNNPKVRGLKQAKRRPPHRKSRSDHCPRSGPRAVGGADWRGVPLAGICLGVHRAAKDSFADAGEKRGRAKARRKPTTAIPLLLATTFPLLKSTRQK